VAWGDAALKLILEELKCSRWFYPEDTASDVSPERLMRFFTAENNIAVASTRKFAKWEFCQAKYYHGTPFH
jgi:hypothetical protein